MSCSKDERGFSSRICRFLQVWKEMTDLSKIAISVNCLKKDSVAFQY